MRRYFWLIFFLLISFRGGALAGDLSNAAKAIRSAGFKYIANNQNTDGSYGRAPRQMEKTLLVVFAYVACQREYKYNSGPFISRAIDWLEAWRQKSRATGQVPPGYWQIIQKAAYPNLTAAVKPRPKKTWPNSLAQILTFCGVSADNLASAAPVSACRPVKKQIMLSGDFTAAKAVAALKAIRARQAQKAKAPLIFGRVMPLQGATGFFADPIVSTALATLRADKINRQAAILK